MAALSTAHASGKPPPDKETVSMTTYKLKLSMMPTAGESGIKVNEKAIKVFQALLGCDRSAFVSDIHDKRISLTNFPKTKESFDKAFGTQAISGRNRQMIIGFNLTTMKTLTSLRIAIRPVLDAERIFLKQHLSTQWTKIDTVAIGHIHLQHPNFADLEALKTMLNYQFKHTKLPDELKEKYKKYFTKSDDFVPPDIYLHPGMTNNFVPKSNKVAANDKVIKANVINFHCCREDVELFKYLITNTTDPKLDIILRSLKYTNLQMYEELLSAHNHYMHKHRNVQIVGICKDAMFNYEVNYGNEKYESLNDYIKSITGVKTIYATRWLQSQGKWYISTNIDDWKHVTKVIDETLFSVYSTINEDAQLGFPTFLAKQPERVTIKIHSDSTVSSLDTYAQSIQSRLLAQKPPPSFSPPAWSTSQPPQAIYATTTQLQSTKQLFPTPDEAYGNYKTDGRSTGNTSTTLTTTITNDQLNSLRSELKQELQSDIMKLNEKIDKLMSSIKPNPPQNHNSIEDRLQLFETKLENIETKFESSFSKLLQSIAATVNPQLVHSNPTTPTKANTKKARLEDQTEDTQMQDVLTAGATSSPRQS